MTDVQQRAAAKHFAEFWQGKGYEKGDSQKFWLSLLSDVFGIEHVAEFIEFEDDDDDDNYGFCSEDDSTRQGSITKYALENNFSIPPMKVVLSNLTPLEARIKERLEELFQTHTWMSECSMFLTIV